MMGDPSLGIFNQPIEASWCRTCAVRGTCQIKEMVAMEQRMIRLNAPKYLDVTVKCRNYINDLKSPPATNVLESLFKL